MSDTTHRRIAQRARELWEAAGRPIGRDHEFWHQAELEVSQPPQEPDTTTDA